MISKGRLEELIEQGATIYCPYFLYYDGIKLDKNTDRITDKGILIYRQIYKYESTHDFFKFDNLFETKEEEEWHRQFGCITRTEKLELPTWEMFDEKKFVWFVDKSQNQCCLYYLNVANKIFINVSGEVIEIGDFTKENYTLACRKAKELFLGEK